MKYLWAILSFLFSILIFYIFYKMIHNTTNPNKPIERWGYWKSTKIFICIFIVFSVLFYSLLHISFIQKLLIPSASVLSMTDSTSSFFRGGSDHHLQAIETMNEHKHIESNHNNSSINQSGGGGGGGTVANGNLPKLNQTNISLVNDHYEYNDNILTDPPNF
jgi:hypothetical protein